MPALLRFLVRHVVVGFSAAALLVAALVFTDTAGFGTVLRASDAGLLAACLVVYFLGLTFSSVQIGIALMTGQATPDDDALVRTRSPGRDRRAG
ncbi:hypothetical protein [Jiella avicenniae]|uniref:Uncharacterized protein n=1 Tax=Jiella avicenniae TaxID=2907202 RepID=A0A9X1P4F4_9HYPH|nr:hypothetical protein [Jiella avicenniae]MCE7029569.1 hypothetical protein [Jiella avicenniae]